MLSIWRLFMWKYICFKIIWHVPLNWIICDLLIKYIRVYKCFILRIDLFLCISLQGGESLSHDRHAGHWTGTAQLVQVKVWLVRKEIIQGAELLRRRTGRLLLLLIIKVWFLRKFRLNNAYRKNVNSICNFYKVISGLMLN